MENDPVRIRELAYLREDTNRRFYLFLKNCDVAETELDVLVQRFHDEVAGRIDCTQCANCCKRMSPSLTRDDVKRLARAHSINPAEFRKRYLMKDPVFNDLVFQGKPCPFLAGTLCSLYDDRPADCRSYPHLLQPGFIFRMPRIMSNYATCPIVFNVVETMKSRLWVGNSRPYEYLDVDDFADVE